MMHGQEKTGPLRCPQCSGELVCIGSRDVTIAEPDLRRRHAYWCSAGCRGPEPDGMFEFFECPSCGSHDTVAVPRADGAEELECNACGTVTILQTVPAGP
jgi:ribosomal protein S27E